MDGITLAHRAFGVARVLTGAEGTKNVVLGMARGVANASLRPEPPIARMAISIGVEAANARAAHQANWGVQLVRTMHEVLGAARAAR